MLGKVTSWLSQFDIVILDFENVTRPETQTGMALI